MFDSKNNSSVRKNFWKEPEEKESLQSLVLNQQNKSHYRLRYRYGFMEMELKFQKYCEIPQFEL